MSPARYICKACGAESPPGIGYVHHGDEPIPLPRADCPGLHAAPEPYAYVVDVNGIRACVPDREEAERSLAVWLGEYGHPSGRVVPVYTHPAESALDDARDDLGQIATILGEPGHENPVQLIVDMIASGAIHPASSTKAAPAGYVVQDGANELLFAHEDDAEAYRAAARLDCDVERAYPIDRDTAAEMIEAELANWSDAENYEAPDGVLWTGKPGDDIESIDEADNDDMEAAIEVATQCGLPWVVYRAWGYHEPGDADTYERWSLTAYATQNEAEDDVAENLPGSFAFNAETHRAVDRPDLHGYSHAEPIDTNDDTEATR